MMVKLVRHTPEPERTVAMSARLCYSPIGAAQLEEKISDEQAANLVRKLVSMGHLSTLEHVTFTFAIEGVSRVLTHQLVRHRIASYSQQSQRYVKEHDFETIVPASIASKPEAKAKFDKLMTEIQAMYDEFIALDIPADVLLRDYVGTASHVTDDEICKRLEGLTPIQKKAALDLLDTYIANLPYLTNEE